MNPDLENLKITERELEELSGFDISKVFVGSVLGGTVRPSAFQSPQGLLWFVLTEAIVFFLTFIFSLPFGLIAIRSSISVASSAIVYRFLFTTLGMTTIAFIGWNFYLWVKAKRLKTLMNLLDEADRYNEILQAIALAEELEAVNASQALLDRGEILSALAAARSSLVSGLMTEKILRQSRGLLSRRVDLMTNIESNLVTLRALEAADPAIEYRQMLSEALAIGVKVYQEVQDLSRR